MLNLNRQSIVRPLGIDPYLNVDVPSPADYGLPDQYTEWRKWQYHTIERILDSPKRFFGLCSPCGSGKSLSSMAAAMMSGKRTVHLTSTLGLQSQIASDFHIIANDIRGMSNYGCVAAPGLGLSPNTTVADAPCQMGYKCSLRFGGGCEYFDLYREAQKAPIIVTNYMCWMYDGLKETSGLHVSRAMYEIGKLAGTGGSDPRIPVDMLVADEIDLAENELVKFVGIDISRRECLHLGLSWPDSGQTIDDWREWADSNSGSVDSRLAKIEARLKADAGGNGKSQELRDYYSSADTSKGWSRDLKSLRDMKRKLSRLADIRANDDWVMQEKETDNDDSYTSSKSTITNLKSVQFSPLSPARYAESTLWRGVEKVVLMSATVRPKTLQLLGIRDDDMEFIEFPSTFPVERRKVIFVPSIQMSYRNEQDDLKMAWWLGRLDAIIKPRLHLKGVVHAVSYARAKFIRDNSEFGRYMLIHSSRDRAQVVEQFRESEPPCLLISPSVGTGYDFQGDQCRYQVLAKIPFMSTQDKLVKARQARDPEYGLFVAAQTIVQMTGRGTRSETDWSANYILDDQAKWFLYKVRKFLPDWWWESLEWADSVPKVIEFSEK